MAGKLRLRKLILALVAIAVAACAVGPGAASAFRRIHHADPIKAFSKYRSPRSAHASAFVSPFASDWPCTPTTTDQAPVIASNAPQVKVIYAFPTDVGADNFTADKDRIQKDAKAIRDRLITDSGTTKTVRFDTGPTGAACTPAAQYLDIQKVALAGTAASYNAGSTFRTLTNELKSKLATPAPGARVNYVVYANRIRATGASGEADIPLDDSHDPLNAVNQGQNGDGRLFAVVYGDPAGGANFNGIVNVTSAEGARQATFLHELSHNLGAVQFSSPHSSGAGHCYDEYDIMCYADGGSMIPPATFDNSGAPTSPSCTPATAFDFSEPYDCNHDDYFNPSPAAGSYLAQHWNSYDSAFLCGVSDCDSALTPPPAITFGTTHVGGRLTFTVSPASPSITHYEWDIDGDKIYDVDTGSTPSITPDFTFITPRTVRVRASKADGTFAFSSATVTPVVPGAQFTVGGKFQVGQTLQLDGTATTDPDGLITKFLWDLDGDGTYETDTGLTRTASATFNSPGEVSVGLEVDFPLGFSQSRTSPFSIAPAAAPPPLVTPPPVAPIPAVAGPSISVAKVKLAKLLKSGLPLVFTCGASCSVKFALSVDAKTAKKFKLKGKRGKPVVIGTLNGGFAKGTTKPSLKLTPAARKALKKARSLKATLAGSVAQPPGSPLKVSKLLSFRR